MAGLCGSEILLYGGLVVMAAVLILAVFCAVIFILRGQKLKIRLEQEYGKPWR